MENIETVDAPCYFCNKGILVAKTTFVPPLYCGDCYTKLKSGVNISEIRRKREQKEDDKRIKQFTLVSGSLKD